MIDLKNLRRAIEQLAEEKNIEPAKIIDAVEAAIAAAYKKEYEKRGEVVKAQFDLKTGELKFALVKTVVDETTARMPSPEETLTDAGLDADNRRPSESQRESASGLQPSASEGAAEELPRYNSDRHLLIAEAKTIKPDVALGEELEFPLELHEDFGRIAAQTAKQVVLQKLREAERESVLAEFKNRAGEIVSGVVQRFERGSVFVDLGRAMGVMFHTESVPGEHYKMGDRLRFLIVAIQEETRIPGIILSRASPAFVAKLFALEVPEVSEGTVEIKGMAREPGSRTKVAVASTTVDPVGACVGQRGTRVTAVSNELGQEKVDIIPWAEDPAQFIGNALSPAKAQSVEILPGKEARVYVEERQLSLAIGRGGQNVRLAAKLTGWRIDVRSAARPEEVQAEGVSEHGDTPSATDDSKNQPKVEE